MASYPLTIGIDARLYGLEHAGIGRYVMNLVDRVIHEPQIKWTLFVNPKYANHFPKKDNLTIIQTPIRHYSIGEQIDFLHLLNKQQLTLLHVPHFNVPIFYKRPFVVTIHDILWHQVRGGNVTTLNPAKYYAKYLGYRLTVHQAVHNARAIFVPSQYVKFDLKKTFPHLPAKKIYVTYEGVSPSPAVEAGEKFAYGPYLLYIGSAYPHKNLPVLLQALKIVRENALPQLKLILVSSRSVFLDQIKKEISQMGLSSAVVCAGYQTDQKVAKLMNQSLCLVHPSKSEGFGLTGLEAMSHGVPVIAARSTSLPEIYGESALFFNADDPKELAKNIITLAKDDALRQQLIQKGKNHAGTFSWEQMTKETVDMYKKVCA